MANDGGAGSGGSGGNGTAGGAGTPPVIVTPPVTPPPVTSDWTTSFNDGQKAFVQNKGFKDPGSLLDSYINYEKLQGVPQDRLFKIPEKPDDPTWGSIHERLGKPKEAKDYKIDIPKENGDSGLGDWLRDFAFKNNLTFKQVENLATSWNERTQGQVKTQSEAAQFQANQAQENLKKEWGQAFDQNMQIIDRAGVAFGITKEQTLALRSAMGIEGAAKFLHSLGTKTGEAEYVSGGKNTTLTPTGAKERIKQLIEDSTFRARLAKGDIEAKTEWDRLHLQQANGQTVSL